MALKASAASRVRSSDQPRVTRRMYQLPSHARGAAIRACRSNQFVKYLAGFEKLVLARAVHQLDAAKQQRIALKRRQGLGQDVFDLGIEYGEMDGLRDAIGQFALRFEQVADVAAQPFGPDHPAVRGEESSAVTMTLSPLMTYAPLRT